MAYLVNEEAPVVSRQLITLTIFITLLGVACQSKDVPAPQSIAHKVHGKADTIKPALVLVHGWMSNQTLWDKQVEHFKDKYQVITLDLAGHGKSSARRDEYTITSFGKDVADIVNTVGASKVVIVGHSMGGPVALEAAELLGDKVVGIVGVDTFYTPFQYPKDDATIQKFVEPFRTDFKGTTLQMVNTMFGPDATQDLKDTVVDGVKKAEPKIGINALTHLFKWKATRNDELLTKHQAKLFNINGDPKGDRAATHPSVVMIKGASHFPAQTKASAFNQALAGFMMKL